MIKNLPNVLLKSQISTKKVKIYIIVQPNLTQAAFSITVAKPFHNLVHYGY